MYFKFLTTEVYAYFRQWINIFNIFFIVRYNDLSIYYLPVCYILLFVSFINLFLFYSKYVLFVIYYILHNY